MTNHLTSAQLGEIDNLDLSSVGRITISRLLAHIAAMEAEIADLKADIDTAKSLHGDACATIAALAEMLLRLATACESDMNAEDQRTEEAMEIRRTMRAALIEAVSMAIRSERAGAKIPAPVTTQDGKTGDG